MGEYKNLVNKVSLYRKANLLETNIREIENQYNKLRNVDENGEDTASNENIDLFIRLAFGEHPLRFRFDDPSGGEHVSDTDNLVLAPSLIQKSLAIAQHTNISPVVISYAILKVFKTAGIDLK